MEDKELRALEIELSRYRSIDKRIAERQLELMSKNGIDFITHQTNALLNSQEKIVGVWDEDITLRNLKLFKETVGRLLELLDVEQCQIFDLRWVRCYSWRDIKDKIHCSKASVYRKREVILELYASLKT